jgi:hypothetical protein
LEYYQASVAQAQVLIQPLDPLASSSARLPPSRQAWTGSVLRFPKGSALFQTTPFPNQAVSQRRCSCPNEPSFSQKYRIQTFVTSLVTKYETNLLVANFGFAHQVQIIRLQQELHQGSESLSDHARSNRPLKFAP